MPLLLILSVDGGLVECGCPHVGTRSLALPYVLAARHRLDVRRSDGVYPLQWWRPTVFERPQRGVGMRYLDSDEAVADICLSPVGDAATASERELGMGALVPNQVVDYVRDLIAAKEELLGTASERGCKPSGTRAQPGRRYVPVCIKRPILRMRRMRASRSFGRTCPARWGTFCDGQEYGLDRGRGPWQRWLCELVPEAMRQAHRKTLRGARLPSSMATRSCTVRFMPSANP